MDEMRAGWGTGTRERSGKAEALRWNGTAPKSTHTAEAGGQGWVRVNQRVGLQVRQ